MEAGEVRSLTGLRGIAACWVVMFHMTVGMVNHSRIGIFLDHGYLAVDLFFVLSGFIMGKVASLPFVDGFRLDAQLMFLQRRFARVWPLYFVVTVFAAIAVQAGSGAAFPVPKGNFTVALLANLAMVQSWCISDSILGPGWSISTEFAAYILFPGLLAVTLFCRWRPAMLVGLACAILLSGLVLLPARLTGAIVHWGPLDMPESRNYSALARCLLEFTMGLLAWRVTTLPRTQQIARKSAPSLALASVLLLLLMQNGTDLIVALLIPGFIVLISNDETFVSRILGSRLIHWLGVISYSLYLTHIFGLILLDRLATVILRAHLPHAWSMAAVVTLAAMLAMAAAAHYGIEKPARVALRKWMGSAQLATANPNLAGP